MPVHTHVGHIPANDAQHMQSRSHLLTRLQCWPRIAAIAAVAWARACTEQEQVALAKSKLVRLAHRKQAFKLDLEALHRGNTQWRGVIVAMNRMHTSHSCCKALADGARRC
jgi:hypothetical protein